MTNPAKAAQIEAAAQVTIMLAMEVTAVQSSFVLAADSGRQKTASWTQSLPGLVASRTPDQGSGARAWAHRFAGAA